MSALASGNSHSHSIPSQPALSARLLPATRAGNQAWFGGDLARVPAEALSMGMGTILRAREVVLIATGGAKATTVERMLKGPITTELPASFLQLHPHAAVMLDLAAIRR